VSAFLPELFAAGVASGVGAPRFRKPKAGGTWRPWDDIGRGLTSLWRSIVEGEDPWADESHRQTMRDVHAQTFTMAEVGARTMPKQCQGLLDRLTLAEERLVKAVIAAYLGGSGGLYDCQTTIAADLRVCERSIRNALNGQEWTRDDGTRGGRPGLVESEVIARYETRRPSGGGRTTDNHWLLLRPGPVLEALLRPMLAAAESAKGVPWKLKSAAQRALARLEGLARMALRDGATRAWEMRQAWGKPKSRTPVLLSPAGSAAHRQTGAAGPVGQAQADPLRSTVERLTAKQPTEQISAEPSASLAWAPDSLDAHGKGASAPAAPGSEAGSTDTPAALGTDSGPGGQALEGEVPAACAGLGCLDTYPSMREAWAALKAPDH